MRPTTPPPFDPSSYARIVDRHVNAASDVRDTPRTMTAAEDATSPDLVRSGDLEAIGRAMYGSYLASDFPEALVLAERVLEQQPDHSLAQLVAERCRAVLGGAHGARIQPSSVLRVRRTQEHGGAPLDPASQRVLAGVDGVSDAARVVERSGIPPAEALERLHALVESGVLEVVA